MQTFYGYYDSPIGLVEIGATSEEVISLFFVEKRRSYAVSNEVCDEAIRQVSEYFDGTRTEFGGSSGASPSGRRSRTGTSPGPSGTRTPCARSGPPTGTILSR